jgi:Dolichyl-phosphate-mannose-protein mannosyltransferase
MSSEAVVTASEDEIRGRRWLCWLLVFFAGVHGVLLTLDLRYPYMFLRGDRSSDRMAAIEALRQLHGWHALVAYFGTHGNLGDYAPQALIYLAGGKYGLLIAQICWMLLSGVCVYRLGRLCELSARASCLATALYLGSPHSLALQHQLCSEAVFVPLLAISTWLMAEAVRGRSLRVLGCGGLLAGFTSLIRPVTLVWPLVACFGLRRYGTRAAAPVFAAAAYLPVVLWMMFVWQQTGTFGMGDSDHSLAVNLYGRVQAIAATMPPDEARAVNSSYLAEPPPQAVTATSYLSFVAHYPLPSLIYALRDTGVFFFKSGVERISVDYFADDQQTRLLQTRNGNGWRQYWDKHGALATIRYGWEVLGITLVISALAAGVQVALILLAVAGAVHLVGRIRNQAQPQAAKLADFLILALPVYVLIFSQLADATQSRHRAPAEFALAILATHGVRLVRAAQRARRLQAQPAPC